MSWASQYSNPAKNQRRHARSANLKFFAIAPGRPSMFEAAIRRGAPMAGLSTHVLDTVRGGPAEGVAIELFEIGAGGRKALKRVVTNSDGRTDAALIAATEARVGTFELVFHVGAYFRD